MIEVNAREDDAREALSELVDGLKGVKQWRPVKLESANALLAIIHAANKGYGEFLADRRKNGLSSVRFDDTEALDYVLPHIEEAAK